MKTTKINLETLPVFNYKGKLRTDIELSNNDSLDQEKTFIAVSTYTNNSKIHLTITSKLMVYDEFMSQGMGYTFEFENGKYLLKNFIQSES